MSKHDVRYVPVSAANNTTWTATTNATNVKVEWYQAVFCDCARCRVLDAIRGAGRTLMRRWRNLDRLSR